MADGDFWETIWALWKIGLGGLVFVGVFLFTLLFFPEYGSTVLIAGIVGTTAFLYAKVTQSRSPSEAILVNYVTSNGISVGGRLELQPESLLFAPSDMEKMFRREPFEIPFEEIESIEHIPRLDDGLVAIFTRAGFSHRIQVKLEDGSEELFTTSDPDSHVERLNSAVDPQVSDVA